MVEGDIYASPAAANALAPASSASAWGEPSWVEITSSTSSIIYIIGATFQSQQIPTVDTTTEILLEISTGGSGAEVVKIQIPYTLRSDTAVSFYHTPTQSVFLPEPYEIAQGTRVAVRVYDSIASSITYGGTKIWYKEGVTSAPALRAFTLLGVG